MNKAATNVYDIRTGLKSSIQQPANDAGQADQLEDVPCVQPDKRNSLGVVARGLLVIVLMWIRGPLNFLLKLASVPCILGLIVVGVGMDASPGKTKIIVTLTAVSFGCFLFRWLYDSLVIKLSPEPLVINS